MSVRGLSRTIQNLGNNQSTKYLALYFTSLVAYQIHVVRYVYLVAVAVAMMRVVQNRNPYCPTKSTRQMVNCLGNLSNLTGVRRELLWGPPPPHLQAPEL